MPLRAHHLQSPAPSVRTRRADIPAGVDTLVASMLAKDPQTRPSAEAVYEALVPLTSGLGGSVGGDDSRDPTSPFRRPLLALAKRRERFGDRGKLADPEVGPLRANVRALLDNDRSSEAISLLEDGIERAGHDPALALQLRHFLGAALFYAGSTRAPPRSSTSSDATTAGISRRPTRTSSTAPTTRATPTPRSASRTRPCRC